MELKIKALDARIGREIPAPRYATDGAAAMDICACIDAPLTIPAGERAVIPTGIAIALPSKEYVALMFVRSGLGIKKGICLSNGIGVIDADYRGEICVGLFNTSSEPFVVNRGDRIAQMMFMPVYSAKLCEAIALDETARGAGGFGSTGVK